jgi:hypothetical protein
VRQRADGKRTAGSSPIVIASIDRVQQLRGRFFLPGTDTPLSLVALHKWRDQRLVGECDNPLPKHFPIFHAQLRRVLFPYDRICRERVSEHNADERLRGVVAHCEMSRISHWNDVLDRQTGYGRLVALGEGLILHELVED